jgi:hypothetical protein
MSIVKIKPVTVSPSYEVPVIAEYAKVSTATVVFGKNASGNVVLGNMSNDKTPVFEALYGNTIVPMTDAQYAAWGTNDEYAIDCFLLNMGLERA